MLRYIRNSFFCILLVLNLMGGAPMRPDQIEELMAAMRQPKIAHVLQEEADNSDD